MIELSSETVAAIVGAVAGMSVSGIGYFWRRRLERIQALNQCLYGLMDVWHRLQALARADARPVLAVLRQKLPMAGVSEEEVRTNLAAFEQLLMEEFQVALQGMAHIGMETIKADYAIAVKALSKEAPLLAYRINGHQDFKERLVAISEMFERLAKAEAFSDVRETAAKQVKQLSDNNLTGIMLEALERDLLALAWATDLVAYFSVRKAIRHLSAIVQKEWEEKAQKLFDEYIRIDKATPVPTTTT